MDEENMHEVPPGGPGGYGAAGSPPVIGGIPGGRPPGEQSPPGEHLPPGEILPTGDERVDNAVAGLSRLPDVPDNLVSEYGSTFETYKGGETEWQHNEKGFNPLPLSGMIGPVRLLPRCRVTIPLT